MKRGEICGMIRKTKGNVSARVPGIGTVLIQKTSLVAMLIDRFPGKGDETGLRLNDAGEIVSAVEIPTYREPDQMDIEDAIAAADDDLDDLL